MTALPLEADDAPLAAPAAWWQPAATGAVLALVLLGRGDLVLLGAALAVAVGGGWRATAALGAVGALALRWGTTDLEAVAGAVGALGPAVSVGPAGAAAACWLAAAALVCCLPGTARLGRIALGAGAAVAVAGPVLATSAGTATVDALAVVGLVLLAVAVPPRLTAVAPDLAGKVACLVALAALGAAAAW